MNQASKGDWVQVFKEVLSPGERAPGLPPETAEVPLTMQVKGFLINESAVRGDTVSVQTLTGRTVNGELNAVNPLYDIDFGRPQPELLSIGLEVRKELKKGGSKR